MLLSIEKAMFLKSAPLFAALEGEELAALAEIALEHTYAPREVVFEENQLPDYLYLVVQGKVEVFRRVNSSERTLAYLGERECFGEMAILDPGAPGRSADARAHEDALVLMLTRQRFEGLERSDPEGCAELSALLCRLAGRRCAETAERLTRWRIMAGPM